MHHSVDLHASIERLPTSPGVYLMKDRDGVVIYVGKAINLRQRVKQYFSGHDGRFHVRFLVQEVDTIDFSLASSEREALILEDTLIKKFRPRYNVRLRDDKTYLSIRLDLKHSFPRIELMRRPRQDGARYFGPYSSAATVRQTVELISRFFPLRTCEDSELRGRTRPCLQYQIKRCLAPCVGLIDTESYRRLSQHVVLVLEGKDQELKMVLSEQMQEAAEALDFEEAARLRDRLRGLEALTARQQVVTHQLLDRDVLGFHREGEEVALAVLPIRAGRMQDSRTFYFNQMAAENAEILASFMTQLYAEGELIPKEVLLPFEMDEQPLLEELLRERAGHKISLHAPQRGDKTRLVDLAAQTAKACLAQELDQTRRAERAIQELQKTLRLAHPPRTLECFDISNTQGKRPVASKVRFEEARPAKSGYRRYRIKTLEERPNDYGMMREILGRRLRRGKEEGGLPDLLVVDGGKGQLNVAVAVLKELGMEAQPVIGFAKPDSPDARSRTPILIDKIFLPGRKNPIVLPAHSAALRMLQALRDESHRFAITYHRSLRAKANLHSILQDIPGVGPKRRRLLLTHFGSLKRLKEAREEDIAAVPGIGVALAGQILQALSGAAPAAPGSQPLDEDILEPESLTDLLDAEEDPDEDESAEDGEELQQGPEDSSSEGIFDA